MVVDGGSGLVMTIIVCHVALSDTSSANFSRGNPLLGAKAMLGGGESLKLENTALTMDCRNVVVEILSNL